MKRKGIILAGGSGSRLYPMTIAVSKQLLPVYNKPLIYHPLTTLMLARITEILVITTPEDSATFYKLLGDGSQWGISLSYAVQPSPDGLAQALIIAEEFLQNAPCALILGDNIFYGSDLTKILASADNNTADATIFAYNVSDPERYGVASVDAKGRVIDIEEKPESPTSNLAVTGLYFYDADATYRAKQLRPSIRNELEITDLNLSYLEEEKLKCETLGRGFAWFDTGTYDSLLEAASFVRSLERRQGVLLASPEGVAINNGWITSDDLLEHAEKQTNQKLAQYYATLLSRLSYHENRKS